jgi:putative peptide zinc metalloprotease protein
MRNPLRRALTAILVALAIGIAAAPSAAADESNDATAVNTEDGSSVFRFALSVRDVADGVVDETNTATAEASCVDCTTIAIAFQVILVHGDADYVAPENKAVAANVECDECLTYAKATQIVVDMDGKVLSANGRRRLALLDQRMRQVERNANNMSDAQLLAEAQYAQRELLAIFNEELVPIGSEAENGTGTTTTTSSTSTTTPTGSSSTTVRSTTSTTDAPTTSTSQAA